MNFRSTAWLFAGVLVLVSGLFVALLTDGDSEVPEGGLVESLTKAGLKEKDVDTVELVRTEPTEGKLVFARVGETKWELREPAGRADSFAVTAIVNDLFRAQPVRYPDLTSNLSVHGLSKPTYTITLRSGQKSATVNVGLTTIGGDKAVTFVTTGDHSDRPLAVRRSDLTALFRDSAKGKDGPAADLSKWLTDFRVRRLLGGGVSDPVSQMKAVKLTTGSKDLALAHTPGGEWTFTAPPGYKFADVNGAATPTPDHFTGVRPLLNALTTLQAASNDDFIENPGDPAKYGLKPDDPSRIRIELTPQDAPPEALLLGKPVEENGKPVVPAKVYAQLEGDSAVVKVSADRVEAIRKTILDPSELRNKDILPESVKDRIEAIDAVIGSATVKLRKVSTGGLEKIWVLYGGPGDPQEAKQEVVASLITALTTPRSARDVLGTPNDAAFAGPERKVELKLWLGGVEAVKGEPGKLPTEPKVIGAPTELIFGKKEADIVYVRRSGEGGAADLKVPEALLALATKGRLDYLDVKLKSFGATDAVSFKFNRGTETFEVTRKTEPDAKTRAGLWNFALPERVKGKSADADRVLDLLRLLDGLAPERVLSEQPSPDELKGWGLDPAAPRMRVTVGLKSGNPKEAGFEFGSETADKSYVYARQSGKPWVFTVLKVVFDRLANDDLRDRTIYRIDPATVTGLKIRGWKKDLGTVGTYEFEKKGADWVAKSPAGFVPDSLKITAVLGVLAAPRAEEFVGAGKPEYGLNVDQDKDAMEFTLMFASGPAITLVTGNAAPGNDKVYAASSAIPGEAVTFNPSGLRGYTDKPGSLQK